MPVDGGPLADFATPDLDARSWGLALRPGADPMVGPLSGFRRLSPTSVVTVIPPDAVPPGRPRGQRTIAEWKGTSAIDYFDFDRYQGLFHHGGGNWVLWNDDLSRLFVTADASWPTTWVHVRFVLRHLIVAGLLTRPEHHCVHAVVAEMASGGGRHGVLVAGPTGSGKTRLVNRLVELGVVSGVVEDDCAVIDDTWAMTSLIPTEHELRRPRQLEIRAAVFLDAEATGPKATPARAAADFASRCPTPWPAPWLPGATARAERMSEPPTRLRALRVPPRSDTDDDVVDAVIRLVTAATGGQRTSTGDGCADRR